MVWDIDIKERVYHRLANEIFFRIYNGYYQLGAKLPTFPVIAKEAGSSLETVRKAIKELQQYSIIEKTCWGYYITSNKQVVSEYCKHYLAHVESDYQAAKLKVNG